MANAPSLNMQPIIYPIKRELRSSSVSRLLGRGHPRAAFLNKFQVEIFIVVEASNDFWHVDELVITSKPISALNKGYRHIGAAPKPPRSLNPSVTSAMFHETNTIMVAYRRVVFIDLANLET